MLATSTKTDLYYYRARYYDPQAGRFLSEDPIEFAGGMDFYAYVGNTTLMFTDPTGTQTYTPKFLPKPNDEQELATDINNVGRVNSLIPGMLARLALDKAQEWARNHNLPGGSVHNGAADAFRHCYWSCMMAGALGESVAEQVADEHEKAGNRHGQPHDEELMDRANNLVGRNAVHCVGKGKNCEDVCTDRYNAGRLYGLGARPNYFAQE